MTTADDQRRQITANFNILSATYDNLRFLQICGSRLTELATLRSGARVLDVATGTGAVAMAAAQIVGATGRVVGMDIAAEMLGRAQQKAARAGLTQVEFREGNAERLDFPDRFFDIVLCASALFFVPDMLDALREWRRVLAPDGFVGFSSFGPSFLQPLRDMWEACLREYGLTAASLPTHRLADPATCRQLLSEAGFTQIEARSEQLGYYLNTAEERWEDIRAGLEGKPLSQLSAVQRDHVKTKHLAEVAALATSQGIWVDVPAIFAFGQQAEKPR